ncbi:MAG: ornithine cyclodeaminase family protein [Vicinamibacterales bacterium]
MALLLNRNDVRNLLDMPDAIAAVEKAFRELAAGQVDMPQRAAVHVPAHRGLHLSMPAWVGGGVSGLGVKIVTVYPDNPSKHHLPTVLAIVLLNDPETGNPVALMDAGYMTAVRTGAVSGVATKYMARADAQTVGVFGAGVQAETQLEAMCAVRKIRSATVYDVDAGRAKDYASRMSARCSIDVVAAQNARDAVEGQDIVVTASTAREPVFDGRWLAAGQHINAVGAHTPSTRELDTATVVRSRVVADLPEACLVEAGELIIPISEGAIGKDHIRGGLGDVVSGAIPGRQADADITLFKSVGLALQDVAVARLVYDRARGNGAGKEFSFS